MQNRFQTLLLAAVLFLTGVSTTLGVVLLRRGPETKPPLVLMVRPGHAPVVWQGWQLTPPTNGAGRDCVQDGYDHCSDGQAQDDAVTDTSDNDPVLL